MVSVVEGKAPSTKGSQLPVGCRAWSEQPSGIMIWRHTELPIANRILRCTGYVCIQIYIYMYMYTSIAYDKTYMIL